jgi:hypothetical protein
MLANDRFRPFLVKRNDDWVIEYPFREPSAYNLFQKLKLESVHHSRVLELINQARRVLAVRRIRKKSMKETGDLEVGIDSQAFTPPKDSMWRDAWATTEQTLAMIAAEAAASGADFVVTTTSSPIQVDPDIERRRRFMNRLGVSDLFYQERRLQELGRRVGFPVIPLGPALQTAATQDKLYLHGFPNTAMGRGHWNETGHRLAAEVLARNLCALGVPELKKAQGGPADSSASK